MHCIHDITPSISDTTSTLSVSSRPEYQLYHTHSLYDITHYIMTSHSVCMISHEHFMTSHPYRCDIISSIIMTSYPIYMLSPNCFHGNTTTIPDISPTIFDITVIAPVLSHPVYRWHHNNYGSHHSFHTYDIIYTLPHITFTLCDTNPQYL